MPGARNVLVVCDEVQHLQHGKSRGQIKGAANYTIEETNKRAGGLDQIHSARGNLAFHDSSATPFVTAGTRTFGEGWTDRIPSELALNDAIESVLGKTPRVVIRVNAFHDAGTIRHCSGIRQQTQTLTTDT